MEGTFPTSLWLLFSDSFPFCLFNPTEGPRALHLYPGSDYASNRQRVAAVVLSVPGYGWIHIIDYECGTRNGYQISDLPQDLIPFDQAPCLALAMMPYFCGFLKKIEGKKVPLLPLAAVIDVGRISNIISVLRVFS